MEGTLKLIEVGRNKCSEEIKFKNVCEDNLHYFIARKAKKYLLSSVVEARNGIIYAGIRPVGKYHLDVKE